MMANIPDAIKIIGAIILWFISFMLFCFFFDRDIMRRKDGKS
jgi:hypothetical protein